MFSNIDADREKEEARSNQYSIPGQVPEKVVPHGRAAAYAVTELTDRIETPRQTVRDISPRPRILAQAERPCCGCVIS